MAIEVRSHSKLTSGIVRFVDMAQPDVSVAEAARRNKAAKNPPPSQQ
jgi:hypothetical protein